MYSVKFCLIVIILYTQYYIVVISFNPTTTTTTTNQCLSIRKCGMCIRTAGCVWCKNPKFTRIGNTERDYSRCNTLEGHESVGLCGKIYYENPNHHVIVEEMSQEKKRKSQVHPHNANITLRVGNKINITMEYFDTENKPLDLYYIMDLSATMADDKPKVATLGTTLAKKIKNITSDVMIGFGSFIDKPIIPFVSVAQLNREETNTSTAPYGFKNHLNLTTDIDRFHEEVKKAKISGNLDAPEGGLDAIMQAVSCQNVIGWRASARHLLILSTDGPFHIAGDAKLGGILLPNDAKCHMDENIYTHSTYHDYPSISQVNTKVQEENVFVIFAVTEENIQLYEMLSHNIDGSTTSGLKEDSDNVVDLVEQEYKKIISSVELPKLPVQFYSFLRVTYYAKCLHNSPYIKGNKCRDLKVGANATFQIEIELIECPKKSKDWEQTLIISPVGVPEKFTIQLQLICDCPCEHSIDEGFEENDVVLCEGKGTIRCGICDCIIGYKGKNCQCSTSETEALLENNDDDIGCKYTNSSLTCSGRGTCICGQCECNEGPNEQTIYSGTFCECDDMSCPFNENGLICSGNGDCKCGKCICNEFYKGESCNCITREIECRESNQDISCNGRGQCNCGKCICDQPFSGRFCQNCPNCPGKCKSIGLLSCLFCYFRSKEEDKQSNCPECDHLSKIEEMDEVFEESDEEKLCTIRDEDTGCDFSFVYGYIGTDRYKLHIKLEKIQRCPNEILVIWIVVGVVFSVLIFGLIILFCWKIIILIHDIREVRRFEKERAAAKWNDGGNPIYKQATSTFKNPAYHNS